MFGQVPKCVPQVQIEGGSNLSKKGDTSLPWASSH